MSIKLYKFTLLYCQLNIIYKYVLIITTIKYNMELPTDSEDN